MTDEQRLMASMEASIRAWPQEFRDLDDGNDVVRWANDALDSYAPALVVGQSTPAVNVGPMLDRAEDVQFSLPAFFDDDSTPQSQAGRKVKFAGKTRSGLLVVTSASVAFAYEMGGSLNMVYGVLLPQVRALNPLTFKFSLLSMTSAGPGYELLFSAADGAMDRVVFRVAVTPRRPDFDHRLRALLHLV